MARPRRQDSGALKCAKCTDSDGSPTASPGPAAQPTPYPGAALGARGQDARRGEAIGCAPQSFGYAGAPRSLLDRARLPILIRLQRSSGGGTASIDAMTRQAVWGCLLAALINAQGLPRRT